MPERKAFHFDANKCTGCQACELACAIENGLEGMSWRQVVTLNESRRPGVPVIHLSIACNHCADAPCATHCPALAYTRDPATGRVDLDPDRCIGCKYCSWACPYDAPRFDAPRGVMTKCTFCGHRQDLGLEPACVEMCPTGALGFGDLEALPGSACGVGLPTVAPGPSIRFAAWDDSRLATAAAGMPSSADAALPADGKSTRPPPSKISLRAEWPLLVFTLLGAVLVAVWTAAAAGGPRVHRPSFVLLALLSLSVSSLHLGQPTRAWRAILNLRRSWLSREIVAYSGFVALAVASVVLPIESTVSTGLVALFGWMSLFAMDRVYDIARPREARPLHSADVVLTAALVTALLLAHLPGTLAAAALKLGLYVGRKSRQRGPAHGAGPSPWTLARVGLGFALPLVAAWLDPSHWPLWALAGTFAGELIDRGELYNELVVASPRRQMHLELERRLARPAAPIASGTP